MKKESKPAECSPCAFLWNSFELDTSIVHGLEDTNRREKVT